MSEFLIKIKLLFEKKDRELFYLVKSIIGYLPNNIELYKQAFLHRSMMKKTSKGDIINNERLEFLGDAVLNMVIASHFYEIFPDKDEGFLTKTRSRVVSRVSLNKKALELNLAKLIKTQPPKLINGTHIPGDVIEALIGAMYLDLGEKKVRNFILDKIIPKVSDNPKILTIDENYKSILIEWVQYKKYSIRFETENIHDPEQKNIHFGGQIFINDILVGTGAGSSKKEAHQRAAEKVLKEINEINIMLNEAKIAETVADYEESQISVWDIEDAAEVEETEDAVNIDDQAETEVETPEIAAENENNDDTIKVEEAEIAAEIEDLVSAENDEDINVVENEIDIDDDVEKIVIPTETSSELIEEKPKRKRIKKAKVVDNVEILEEGLKED